MSNKRYVMILDEEYYGSGTGSFMIELIDDLIHRELFNKKHTNIQIISEHYFLELIKNKHITSVSDVVDKMNNFRLSKDIKKGDIL